MKTNYKNIYLRTKQMLTQPAIAWPEVLQEDFSVRDTFRNYLFPIAIWISVIVFLLSLIQYSSLQAVGVGMVHLISTISGAWLTYLIIRGCL